MKPVIFLAIDFDKEEWREGARAFLKAGRMLGVPATLEISRSGIGAMHGYFSRRKLMHVMRDGLERWPHLVGHEFDFVKWGFADVDPMI
jgi:hypothetical protein